MNPVLLKPEADTQSYVVVRGVVDRELTATPWQDRHDALWIPMVDGYDDLATEFDLVVIEGAGSPAEINLVDEVNNRIVEHAHAAALLVSDIDRNDPTLLAPGPAQLTEMTGTANAGVLPMLRHRLPREEGAVEHGDASAGAPSVAIPRLPFGSNLDEFHMLSHAASVRWVTDAASFERADFVILPGSKHVVADLAWMRERGLDGAVARAAAPSDDDG